MGEYSDTCVWRPKVSPGGHQRESLTLILETVSHCDLGNTWLAREPRGPPVTISAGLQVHGYFHGF